MGKIETESTSKIAVRKGKIDSNNSNMLQGLDLDEDSDKPMAEQLRDSLSKHGARVIDLFREWDDDNSGSISKKEFCKERTATRPQTPHTHIRHRHARVLAFSHSLSFLFDRRCPHSV